MIVIFDNNAYRDLVSQTSLADVDAEVEILNIQQQAHGHRAVASPVVALELVARLRSPRTPAFDIALRAIAALVRNCEETTRPGAPIRILMDPDANLCLALFGRLPPDAKANLESLTGLLKRLSEERPSALNRQDAALVQEVAAHVDAREQSFISDAFTRVVQPLNPGISSWEELQKRPDLSAQALEWLSDKEWARTFARVQVLKAADALSLMPAQADVEERTTWLQPYLKTPFALYTEVVKRVLVDGARLSIRNRANWFWDIHILFGVGPEHTAVGETITLVTSDADMVAAASRSGAATVVATYHQYRAAIA